MGRSVGERRTVDGTEVIIDHFYEIDEDEIRAYLAHIHEQYPRERITELTITAGDGGQVILDYSLKPPKFERIRRLTGYLTTTVEKWNAAKQAEERDRIKHTLEGLDTDE